MLNHDRMVNVRSAADIRPALKDGKVACHHTIENATFFAEDPALIEVLKSLGVLMSSLSWNAQGPLASGHDTHAGLTGARHRGTYADGARRHGTRRLPPQR